MTEEIINCDFYNDKICNLFTEYFKFKVECKNLSLCTVEDDAERECPYKQLKRLEQENKQMKSALEEIREIVKQANKDICDNCGWHNTDGCMPNGYLCHDLIEIKNKINEVLE